MLKELDDYNWEQVFKYGGTDSGYGGYSPQLPTAAGHGMIKLPKVSLAAISRDDVKKITAIADGENDGPNWIVVGKLKDGRWFMLTAGCDYTGWG